MTDRQPRDSTRGSDSPVAPRVSVGIPVYNGERYISGAIEGMLAQTFTNIEVIISDNASTDATEEIVRSYLRRDSRLRYERLDRNVGAARNFNRLVWLAKAPYFRWAASDDLNAPTSIERCLKIIEADRAIALVYAKTQLIDAEGDPLREYSDNLHLVSESPSVRFDQFLERVGLCNALFGIMRTDVMRRTGLWGVFVGADIPFLAEMTLWGKFWEVDQSLFQRRFHEHASSALSARELGAFFDPDGGERITDVKRARNHLGAHLRAVLRAPLPLGERLRALRILARKARWERSAIVQGFLPGR